jgi:hypothetical protein
MNAQNMRLSDAERAEAADRLGKHFADGRLDKMEYDERVSRVMSAKTRADLEGLFDDLPGSHGSQDLPGAGAPAGRATGVAYGRRRVGPMRMVAFLVLAIVALSIAGHVASSMLWWVFAPWWLVPLIVGFIAFRVLTGRTRSRTR